MSMASNGGTQHLAWLLGCLDSAVECLDWCGRDVDARREAEDAITRTDRWGHSCKHTETRQLVLG